MPRHAHTFIENYNGMVGIGFDRETDENTVIYCLQKFSDDQLMEYLRKKLTGEELHEIFNLCMRLLKTHLSDAEYHRYFLKDE
jgi:hypothetical protein